MPLAAGERQLAPGVYYLRSNVALGRNQQKLVVVGTARHVGPAGR